MNQGNLDERLSRIRPGAAGDVNPTARLAILSNTRTMEIFPLLEGLLGGQFQALYVDRGGRWHLPIPPLGKGESRGVGETPVLLPGAFNPVHEGHWGLAAVAERLLRKPVAFELSVVNVDKPMLTPDEALRRVAQFTGRAAVWVTRLPTFFDKARYFPGAIFVVGVDTAERILAPRYYGGLSEMLQGLAAIRQHGCRFLVAGRANRTGRFQAVADLAIPGEYGDLFTGIPRREFQVAISSSELRQGKIV